MHAHTHTYIHMKQLYINPMEGTKWTPVVLSQAIFFFFTIMQRERERDKKKDGPSLPAYLGKNKRRNIDPTSLHTCWHFISSRNFSSDRRSHPVVKWDNAKPSELTRQKIVMLLLSKTVSSARNGAPWNSFCSDSLWASDQNKIFQNGRFFSLWPWKGNFLGPIA